MKVESVYNRFMGMGHGHSYLCNIFSILCPFLAMIVCNATLNASLVFITLYYFCNSLNFWSAHLLYPTWVVEIDSHLPNQLGRVVLMWLFGLWEIFPTISYTSVIRYISLQLFYQYAILRMVNWLSAKAEFSVVHQWVMTAAVITVALLYCSYWLPLVKGTKIREENGYASAFTLPAQESRLERSE